MKLWATLRADLFRYRARTTAGAFLSAWWHEPGFRFTWYLRKATYYGSRWQMRQRTRLCRRINNMQPAI